MPVSVQLNTALTVKLTTWEVPEAEALSVALAVIACAPNPASTHSKLYGAVGSSPIFVVPSKNSTNVIVPSKSLAAAVIVIG